jgi:hypothetical protein
MHVRKGRASQRSIFAFCSPHRNGTGSMRSYFPGRVIGSCSCPKVAPSGREVAVVWNHAVGDVTSDAEDVVNSVAAGTADAWLIQDFDPQALRQH